MWLFKYCTQILWKSNIIPTQGWLNTEKKLKKLCNCSELTQHTKKKWNFHEQQALQRKVLLDSVLRAAKLARFKGSEHLLQKGHT